MQLPQGMAYGWWHFPTPTVNSITFTVEIAGDTTRTPGRYLQLYQGQIAGVGMYLGFQTDVFRPNLGWTGKGLIFSRWQTRNSADARAAENGWLENAGHEGDFVGVRVSMEWGTGTYECSLAPLDTDDRGVWYDFNVRNTQSGELKSAGHLRFPATGIHSGGGSWTEVYSGATSALSVPETVLRVSLTANDGEVSPIRCDTSYNDRFPLSDAFVTNCQLVLQSGAGVQREHPAAHYHLDA